MTVLLLHHRIWYQYVLCHCVDGSVSLVTRLVAEFDSQEEA